MAILNKTNISKREQTCLLLLLKGYTYEEIGIMLFINDKTVASHIQSIKYKLGVNKRYELFSYAFNAGILSISNSHNITVH